MEHTISTADGFVMASIAIGPLDKGIVNITTRLRGYEIHINTIAQSLELVKNVIQCPPSLFLYLASLTPHY